MFKPAILRRILLAPPTVRSSLLPYIPRQPFNPTIVRQYATSPNVTQTSFWINLIPKPLRGASPRAALKKKTKSKEWNPATFYIIIFLLIGSMSIQMIALRNEFQAFSRRADAKIGLLKEIIERIQNGEDVDVEGLLGTGDKAMEKEWEEVLQDIEREDKEWENSRKPRPKSSAIGSSESPQDSQVLAAKPIPKIPERKEEPKKKAPVGFY